MTKKDIRYKSISKILLDISVVVFVLSFFAIRLTTDDTMSIYSSLAGILALFAYAMVLCHQTNYFSLLRKFNQRIAFSYTVILGIILFDVFGLASLVAGSVIIAYYFLFLSYDNKYSGKFMFLTGLVVGLIAIYQPSVLYLLPILCLSLIPQKAFGMRNIVALLYSSLMPLLIYVPIVYAYDKTYVFGGLIENFEKHFVDISLMSFKNCDYRYLILWGVFFIANIVFYLMYKYKSKIDNIKNQNIINSNNILTYGILLLSVIVPEKKALISLALIPTAINISYNIFSINTKFSFIFILVFNVLLIFVFFSINYFHTLFQ